MKALYATQATAKAGRNGQVITDDGKLDLSLSYPKALGGSGLGTNPEQLFAAGYAACFSNAILHVAKENGLKLTDAKVTAKVGLIPKDEGGFSLTANLEVELDLEQKRAVDLVKIAHHVCPYSNAISDNIDVQINLNGSDIF